MCPINLLRKGTCMSILARYRKPGGFKQLLQLIETSQPTKQEKLLEVVEKEDPQWAQMIREKKITPEMVLGWKNDHLVIIFEHMMTRHCACLFKMLGEEKLKEFRDLFRGDKYRDIKNIFDDSADPLDTEVVAANNHLLETVRFLDEEKKINLRYINPLLDLSEAS